MQQATACWSAHSRSSICFGCGYLEQTAIFPHVRFLPQMRRCGWSVNDPKPDVSFRSPAAPNRQSR